MPPDLREGLPVDDARPRRPPAARAARRRLPRVPRRAEPLREAGKLGGILFQLPPYVVWKPSSLDYLEWARDQLGADELLVEFRAPLVVRRGHPSRAAALARGAAHELGHRRRAEGRRAATCRATLVAATTPLAYVRFHGRNAATWNTRGGSARRSASTTSTREDELREWVEPLRELPARREEAYAFFNNNNQTDGVAQAPAGAQLLRKLLEEEDVPTA